jgi:hypothetical protein
MSCEQWPIMSTRRCVRTTRNSGHAVREQARRSTRRERRGIILRTVKLVRYEDRSQQQDAIIPDLAEFGRQRVGAASHVIGKPDEPRLFAVRTLQAVGSAVQSNRNLPHCPRPATTKWTVANKIWKNQPLP